MAFPTTGLLGYWKLDESSGNASDSVGSNPLVNTNTVGYAAALINNGADFGTANTNKSLRSAAALLTSGNISISFWVKVRTVPADGTAYGIAEHASGDAGSRVTHIIYYATEAGVSKLKIDYHTNTTADTIGTVSATLNTASFDHIVYTYDGTNMRLYRNNSLILTTAASGTGTGTVGTGMSIGTSQRFSTFASIYADECGVWNTVLSASDVTNLYNGGAGLPYSAFSASGGTLQLMGV